MNFSLNFFLRTLICALACGCLVSCSKGTSENERKKNEADSLYIVGTEKLRSRKLFDSYYNLNEALTRYRSLNDSIGMASAHVMLALTSFTLDNSEELDKELHMAEPYINSADNETKIIYHRLRAIICTSKLKHYKEAEKHIKISIDVAREANDSLKEFTDLGNLAEIYVNSGNTKAARHLIDSLYLLQLPSYHPYVGQWKYIEAQLLRMDGHIAEAVDAARTSLQVARDSRYLEHEVEILAMLKTLDSIAGNKDAYIEDLEQYQQLSDSLNGRRVTHQINQLNTKYEVNIHKIREQEKRKSLWTTITIMALVLLLLLSVVMILMNRLNRERTLKRIAILETDKLQGEMARNDLEKELLRWKVSETEKKLMDVQSLNDPGKNDTTLAEESQISNSSTVAQDSVFDPDPPVDLYRKLSLLFPDLSKADIRMMYLIKKRCEPRKIIKMLNISMSSLYTARYRLRKKLHLKPEDNLDSYIDERI